MKILYYNWVQFDKKNNDGGGVNVYQKNIIDFLVKNTDHEIYFLSSGIYYDLLKKDAYIRPSDNIYGDRCKSFKLINSSVPAPSKAIYDDVDAYLEDEITYNLFKKFVADMGGFDVIHFNNIEGLSGKCLEIKKDFPDTKVIYSVHNYFLFCPQINLFFDAKENCVDFACGEKCRQCLAGNVGRGTFVNYYKIDGICEKMHIEKQSQKLKLFAKKLREKLRSGNTSESPAHRCTAQMHENFRKTNVQRINSYVDTVLAVSERVRDISVRMGIDPEKIYTNYIGTKFAENSLGHLGRTPAEDHLTIAYMGYFDRIKGFDFLIEALEKLPDELARHIKFVCYAKVKAPDEQAKVERIAGLNGKFYAAEHHNGYDHTQLANILSGVDVGLIPVVWEDNLPQIAIEYAAHGVPVLASDLGGAHELSASEHFVFKAGDQDDFTAKLQALVQNKALLNDYFDKSVKLTTMQEHMDKLFAFYGVEK